MDAASGDGATGVARRRHECSIGVVKRLAAVFVGGLGFGALLRRRRRTAPAAVPADTDTLAEELRAKLAESRAATEEPAADEAVAPEPSDLDSRRRDVHDRARQALDELG
jgi:hypothetical protein